ncbi:hypothetical protein B0J11DRAFT_513437 [Dendryphion nanum]|uniref:Uncharacterized protein n=1 Tax=Dendryphion nanum TaxID=256645 RepID=A0A9P9EJ44_9PLEO|nr:hypothetical protein B0J11DRAFT_513437 [Dendryphion nanum]
MNKIEAEKKAIEKRATARKYFDDEFNKHGWVRKRKREDNEEDEKDNGVDDNKTKTLRAKKLKEGNDNHLDSTRRDSDDDESGDDNRPNQSAAPKAGRKKTSTTTTSVPKKPLRANNRTGASSKNSNGAKSKTGTWVPEEQNTHESTKDQMKQRGKKPRRVSHGGWVWQTKDLEAGSDAEWQDLRTSEEEREARAGLKAQTEADSLERKAVREKKVREAWKKDQMKRDQAKGETMNWEGRRVSRVDIVMIDRP